jgi:hypothetical protein
MKINLFLSDFRSIIKNASFNSGIETSIHHCYYWEDKAMEVTYFYKPVGSVLYFTAVMKGALPENVTIAGLKSEFRAVEVISQIDAPQMITGTISR